MDYMIYPIKIGLEVDVIKPIIRCYLCLTHIVECSTLQKGNEGLELDSQKGQFTTL